MRTGQMPVGSRRRRAAVRATPASLPFEQLPYQAFQEARQILAADRAQKLAEIEEVLSRISKLQAKPAAQVKGGQKMKDRKLQSMKEWVELLKIRADANDPVIKKRFEDGMGDMNKPIYRYYAEKKWRSYDYRLIQQRISQFHIVPDLLPSLQPTADVDLFFRQRRVQPGEVVESLASERPPKLRVQVFDKGERLVTVAVVDPDVPSLETDGFVKRAQFLAANIPLSPTATSLPLGGIVSSSKLVLRWQAPYAQKGSPYHRLAVVLLEQKRGPLDAAALRAALDGRRDGFSLRDLAEEHELEPVGFTMFRSVWDDGTAEVMGRLGAPGADIELRPTRIYSQKPPVKPRGWEAKRQGPKYRQLWKYTKRIKGVSNARGWAKKR